MSRALRGIAIRLVAGSEIRITFSRGRGHSPPSLPPLVAVDVARRNEIDVRKRKWDARTTRARRHRARVGPRIFMTRD